MTMMNPFEGLGSANFSEKGNYFSNGTYKLRCTRCILKDTREVGLAYIVNFEVLESNNPKHTIGSEGTWFQPMSQNKEQALNSVLEYVYSQLGYPKQPDALAHFDANVKPTLNQLVLSSVHNAAVFGGRTIGLHVKTQQAKKSRRFFGLHTWSAWTMPQGWQPQPTPAQPAEDQTRPINNPAQGFAPPVQQAPYGAPQGYPQQPYGQPQGQMYGQQPQQPAYPAPQAPYGAPGMPPVGAPPQAPYGAPAPQAPIGYPPPGGPPGYPAPGTPTGWPQR